MMKRQTVGKKKQQQQEQQQQQQQQEEQQQEQEQEQEEQEQEEEEEVTRRLHLTHSLLFVACCSSLPAHHTLLTAPRSHSRLLPPTQLSVPLLVLALALGWAIAVVVRCVQHVWLRQAHTQLFTACYARCINYVSLRKPLYQ
jgi:uncharacterized membrane protein YdbT with pleckstrin-like domain